MRKSTALLMLATLPVLVLGSPQQCTRKTPIVDRFLVSTIGASTSTVCLRNSLCKFGDPTVKLSASTTDPCGESLTYRWSVAGGKVSGEGRSIVWDLSDLPIGEYTAAVNVSGKCAGVTNTEIKIAVVACGNCHELAPQPCPMIEVSCPEELDRRKPFVFSASINPNPDLSYNWKLNAGKIIKGQSTREIEVDPNINATGFERITATVEVGGFDPSCTGTSASCSTRIR